MEVFGIDANDRRGYMAWLPGRRPFHDTKANNALAVWDEVTWRVYGRYGSSQS